MPGKTPLMDYNSADNQDVRFIIASNEEYLDRVYRLRYRSYIQRNEIDKRKDEKFKDVFDDLEETTNFLAIRGDIEIGGIRTIISKNNAEYLSSSKTFPDILSQSKFSQSKILEGSRFCILEEYQEELPMNIFLPFMKVVAWMSYINKVDFVVNSPHAHHKKFYQSLMKFDCLSEERLSGTGVNFKVILMCGEWKKTMKKISKEEPDLFRYLFKDSLKISCLI
jgi:hypothetical protein